MKNPTPQASGPNVVYRDPLGLLVCVWFDLHLPCTLNFGFSWSNANATGMNLSRSWTSLALLGTTTLEPPINISDQSPSAMVSIPNRPWSPLELRTDRKSERKGGVGVGVSALVRGVKRGQP